MARSTHNGATRTVAQFIDDNGPSTIDEIAAGTGLKRTQVRDAVNLMQSRLGGVTLVSRAANVRIYGKPGRDEVKGAPKRSDRVAGPRYVGDIRTVLQRDPFEHQRLALAGR